MSAPVLLYDGLCGFCDGAVQFVMRHDRHGRIRFATLQGEYARALLERHPSLREVDSLILVEETQRGERVLVRSTGALRVAQLMGGPWKATALLRIVPRVVRDWAYDLFARNRYRMFGRRDACRLPSAEERGRFIA